jgi:hypothetical protein
MKYQHRITGFDSLPAKQGRHLAGASFQPGKGSDQIATLTRLNNRGSLRLAAALIEEDFNEIHGAGCMKNYQSAREKSV